ncbi:Uma2 family endonuclease [Streptomyces durbertensis]|uniref:Uma2 family endonuclease n=1 Tax=Streptomyces durbertensis TaxID=2448886 RepID=A0ABR6EFF3_9ACTN|nr:Uma2 family endonuclease [Streptomyces durbertensis]MBB1244074.1 Uma2 family endonuclease [Streptomyces durbertensis]
MRVPPPSRLAALEDAHPGHRTELVDGRLVHARLRPFDTATRVRLWRQAERQLGDAWGVMSDVPVPVSAAFEFCPDLAVLPAEALDRNQSAYPARVVRLAISVATTDAFTVDYEVKDREYARAGIPAYLIFDPYRAHCVAHWNPGPDGYRGRDTIAYGDTVSVKTPLGELTFDTTELPVDPAARG